MQDARALLMTMLALAATPALGDVPVRSIERSYELSAQQDVLLDVPLGDVFVSSGESGRVEIEILIECGTSSSRCREQAEELVLEDSLRDQGLRLEIEGYSNKLTSRPRVKVHLRMPAGNALDVEIGAGDLEVEDLIGSLDIEVGVGEVRAVLDPHQVGSVRLNVGVGSADLLPHTDDRWESGFLFLGHEIYWDEGKGPGSLVVDVGVGEARVRLR